MGSGNATYQMALGPLPEVGRSNNETSGVLREVADERHRQLAMWGEQLHAPRVWYAILGEEFGEVGKELNEKRLNEGEYRKELIQVAAVAVAAVEALDKCHT